MPKDGTKQPALHSRLPILKTTSAYSEDKHPTLHRSSRAHRARNVLLRLNAGEWDYEPTFELSAGHRTRLTMVLGAINNATAADFDVSLDILVWGLELPNRGSTAPLDWRPYIDINM